MQFSFGFTSVGGGARCALWMLAMGTGSALLPGVVSAQTLPAQEQGKSTQPSWWLEPHIAVQYTVTSNVRQDASDISDQVTEVLPGLRWVGNTARIKGFADYTLHAMHYAHNSGYSNVRHDLNAHAAIEAIKQRVYVDVDGVVGLQPLSVFGAPVNGALANTNAVQTSRFGVSPYLRGRFGSAADYEARYSAQYIHSGTDRRSNVTVQDWRLHLNNQQSGQRLGWSVEGDQERVDFSLGRSLDTTTLRTRLNYAAMPQLMLGVVGGVESTNQISVERESHRIVGVNVDWRPSERTRLTFERESRYFGESHNVLLEHRTARTVWRYTDSRGVSNGLGTQSASMGGMFDLLDGFYAPTEPDPIRRTQLVLAEMGRLGLPADFQVSQDFLRSSSTLQRSQQLSLALLGRRSVVTLAVMQSQQQRLGLPGLSLGDDFDTNTNIRQRGWSLLLSHRLTPHTSVQASLIEQRSVGTAPDQETRVRLLSLGLNTLLAPRTSGAIVLRRTVSNGRASPYNESALVATLTHRF